MVFCAVMAVIADVPCTPNAANVFRSAWMPAPPPLSEPAIVSATGCGLLFCFLILIVILNLNPRPCSFRLRLRLGLRIRLPDMEKDRVLEVLIEIGVLLELKG